MQKQDFKVVIEQDENGIYTGEIIGLPACYTQAKSIPELLERLMEVAGGSVELLSDIGKNPQNRKFNLSMNLQYA